MPTIRLLEPGEVPVALLSNVLPAPLGNTPTAGVSTYAARADHNHDDSELRDFVANKTEKVEFEIDFGSTARRSHSFSIAVTGITVGSAVSVTQSGNSPTGKDADENEMDMFICNGRCGVAGTLIVNIASLFGPVMGKYKFIAVF